MMRKKTKTLVFKRCYFSEGYNGTIEQIISGINDIFPDHKDRVYNPDLFKHYIISAIEKPIQQEGVFIRIVSHDETGTGIIHLKASQRTADIEEHLPPEDTQFLENDILLYIVRNHVIACNIGNKDTLITNLILEISTKASLIDNSTRFRIADVHNALEIKKLSDIGVKRIDLDVANYLANLRDLNKGPRWFQKAFGSPDSPAALQKKANTCGKLTLSSSGRKKIDEISIDDWLTDIGQSILDDDIRGYTFILEDGSRMSSEQLKVTKRVALRQVGNTTSDDDAKAQTLLFYKELQAKGSLE